MLFKTRQLYYYSTANLDLLSEFELHFWGVFCWGEVSSTAWNFLSSFCSGVKITSSKLSLGRAVTIFHCFDPNLPPNISESNWFNILFMIYLTNNLKMSKLYREEAIITFLMYCHHQMSAKWTWRSGAKTRQQVEK